MIMRGGRGRPRGVWSDGRGCGFGGFTDKKLIVFKLKSNIVRSDSGKESLL